MSFSYGNKLKISIFGQSHSTAMGVVIDGLRAGIKIDEAKLADFMKRRAPGNDEYSTRRAEADKVEFISGIVDGQTCGAPVCAVIQNTNMRSKDYDNLRKVPRPSHADFAAWVKFGDARDAAGGGQFSGRLTAPMCAVGGILKQIYETKGIYIGAHIASISDIEDDRFDSVNVTKDDFVGEKDFPVINDEAGEKMKAKIRSARLVCDSVGGTIECAITGLNAGLGDAMFGALECKIAGTVFAIPAVKGIEFGSGFEGSKKLGSENNDPFRVIDGKVKTITNNHGGILGGITSGMPVIFRAAFKPTPSIAKEQESVDLDTMENTTLEIHGRHDPCIVKRATACVEAAAAIALADLIL